MFDFWKLIWSRLKEKHIDDLTLISIFKNSVVEVFKLENNIDITENIISIKKTPGQFLIKTNKPVINKEISFLQDKILERYTVLALRIGKSENIKIKYI